MQAQPAPAPSVCLLTSNALTIADFQGALYLANYALRVKRSDGPPSEADQFPEAGVYAIEVVRSLEATQEVVVRLLAHDRDARILMLADSFDEASAFPLLSMGVKGLLLRSEVKSSLQRAVAALHHNGFWVPRPLLSAFVTSVLSSTRRMLFALGSADISEAQQKLLSALMETDSDEEICARLNLTPPDLKSQIAELMKRFNVRRRWDLVLLAHQSESRPK